MYLIYIYVYIFFKLYILYMLNEIQLAKARKKHQKLAFTLY